MKAKIYLVIVSHQGIQMRSAFLVIFSMLSLSSVAGTFPTKEEWKCEKAMENTLSKLSVSLRGNWQRNSHSSTLPVYSHATSVVAEWIIVEKTFEGAESITLTSGEKKTRYDYKPDSGCSPSINITQLKKATRGLGSLEWLDDKALQDLLKKKPDGVLFIWSPHMKLSLISIAELRRAADGMGLPVTFAMDPIADQKKAKQQAEKYKIGDGSLRRVDSVELSMRNVLLHFPTLLVTRNGKICEKVQRGYRKADRFQAIITDIYGACK